MTSTHTPRAEAIGRPGAESLVGRVDDHVLACRRRVRRAVEERPSSRVVVDVGGERLHDVRASETAGKLGRDRTARAELGNPGVECDELWVVGDVQRVLRQGRVAAFVLREIRDRSSSRTWPATTA